jgi:hypothetical protein
MANIARTLTDSSYAIVLARLSSFSQNALAQILPDRR